MQEERERKAGEIEEAPGTGAAVEGVGSNPVTDATTLEGMGDDNLCFFFRECNLYCTFS